MAEEKAKQLDGSNEKGMNAKEMIETNSEKKTVIRYGDRKKVEIISKTKHYKIGQVISPHVIMAEQLIKDKIAKAV